jgi:cellulose synthase/poly-beta-1,6-N-acetylglucosamine synthase-like glycosyltransferase
VLLTLIVVAVSATAASTLTLAVVGSRWKRSGLTRLAAVVIVGNLVVGEVVARGFGLPSRYVLAAEGALAVAALGLGRLRSMWNAVGVWFFANLLVAEVAYVTYAAWVTFFGGLRPSGVVLSATLLVLELGALALAATFAFETTDVVCRTRWDRHIPEADPAHLPFVSVHVAAYNEPPDMLIETIRSLEALDYPAFEIVVIDNNTNDPSVWKPVEQYCADRPRVRFVHVAPWPGFKSGALNLALAEHIDQRAEVIGIIDADYIVDPTWLRDLVGHFAEPSVAFVQSPQDYREWEGDTYLTACHDAYAYFFATAMRSRNERNSSIFGGTMGLIRRSVLDEIGGWDEWCITEDAEASVRILAAGHQGIYIDRSYGKGIMPLTFDALKRQRFRWCFGGIQILRKHRRRLIPWQRHPKDELSTAQRVDFLIGGLQWGSDLVSLGFTAVLLLSTVAVLTGQPLTFRPFVGPAVVLPVTLAFAGALRAIWALRLLSRVTTRRAVLAFLSWMSLSLTVAYATARGIVRRDGVFLRTPKWRDDGGLIDALRSARAETALAAGLGLLAAAAAFGGAGPALVFFTVWQAAIYATAPTMAWLNLHTELSTRLRRRQRTEDRRERVAAYRPHAAAATLVLLVSGGVSLVALSTADPGTPRTFELPDREAQDDGPLGNLGLVPEGNPGEPADATTTTTSTTVDGGTPGSSSSTTAAQPTTTSTSGGAPTSSTASTIAPPTSGTTPSTTPSTPTSGGPPTSLPGGGPPTSRP